jgi:hypothetical protein
MTDAIVREAEFAQKQLDILDEKISEEDLLEILKDGQNENLILSKYKKWAELLDEQKREFRQEHRQSIDDYNDDIKEGINFFIKIYHQCRNMKK